MSLTNIKLKNRADSGFTIVELLIVVVVIAILAAITIVSYNGITARANASAAAAAAATVQKKAEAYNAENSGYPSALTSLTGATSDKSYYLTGVAPTTNLTTNPTSSNGTNTVLYLPCGINSSATTTAPTQQSNIGTFTGAQITYYDFKSGGTATITNNIGQISGTYAATGKTVGCPTAP